MNFRSLETLFLRFRDRSDGSALAAVFDATAKELFEVACHLVRDPSAAEDLVQATFLTAIRKADQFDGQSPLKGWLYGILWREAAKHRRSAARRFDPRDLTARESIEPSAELEAAELSSVIRRALDELPRRYREVLEPLVHDGKAADEIARDLGRSPGTVRSQIHRGMQRLRRTLPAGLASSPAWMGVSVRGLADVRSQVLRSAGCSSAATAAGSAAMVSSVLGGVVMTKTMWLASSVMVAAFAAGWFGRELTYAETKREALPTDRSSAVSAAPAHDMPGVDGSARDQVAAQTPRALAQDPVAARPADPADAVSYWLARFNEKPGDWRHGLAMATLISKLEPNEALRIMTGVWPSLEPMVKEQALRPFTYPGGHPRVLPILHLAATDSALTVQGRAFKHLQEYAFRDFGSDYEEYMTWASKYKDVPLDQVLRENARQFVDDLLRRPAPEIAAALRSLKLVQLDGGARVGVDVASEIRKNGGLRVLETCLQSDDPTTKRTALAWTRTVQPDESWLRNWILPMIESTEDADQELVSASLASLSRPDCGFARDPILAYLRRSAGASTFRASPAARALASIGDPTAIPALIDILLEDKTGKLTYDVGYYGLAHMTGVTWQESCDGAWWLDWWTKNQGRFPPEVAAIPIRR